MEDSEDLFSVELLEQYNYSTDGNDSTELHFSEGEEHLRTVNLFLGGYFCVILSVFGTFANIGAILIFCKKSFKSNFNNLLIALAVTDLLFLLLRLIEAISKIFQELHSDSNHWLVIWSFESYNHLIPYFLYPFGNIFLSLSIFMTVSISIERYLAIYFPLVYRNRSSTWNLLFHILPVLSLAVIINIPKFLECRIDYYLDEEKNLTKSFITVTEMRMDKDYVLYYLNVTRLIFLGLAPLSFLTVLNVRVYSAIQRNSNLRQRSYSIILLLIVSVFIICQLPRMIFNIYEVLILDELDEHRPPPLWSFYFLIFSNDICPIVNATVNFFIYFFIAKKFRAAFFNILLCKKDPAPGIVSKTSFRTGEITKVNTNVHNDETRKMKMLVRMTDLESRCEDF